MIKYSIKIFLLTYAFVTIANAQAVRTEALGGMKFSIVDRELSLTPFDFGGNPAWMYIDESETFLRIVPEYGNEWGNYKRKYDAEGQMNLGASFHGVKKLGELGTFSGFTAYTYENRRDYFRSLIKDSYTGEGFHLTDTTESDFRYMGPKVVLMYSWEPLENLLAGGSVTYHLLDGLKEKFSYAKSIYRDTELNLGLAYQLSENFVLGANLIYFDSQESIEASDVNLFEVELFFFRGDKYFVSKRSSSVTGKIRKQGAKFSSQLYWDDKEKLSLGIQLNYSPSNSKMLRLASVYGEIFSDVEDSYADFKSLDIQIKSQYKVSDDLMAGCYAAYFNNKSWSKISMKELLTWEWKTSAKVLGVGGSCQVSKPLLLAFEYEFSNSFADSSKYIDNKMTEVTTNDHEFRFGAEYKLTDEVLFRGGVKFGTRQYDLVLGGKDCNYYKLSGGFSFPLLDVIIIDTNLQYLQSNSGNNNLARNYLAGSIGITLTTF